MRTLHRSWPILALCGILDLALAVLNLALRDPAGSLNLRKFASIGSVRDMSLLALAAGICAIAAGLAVRGRDRSWLWSLHGVAMAAFGLLGASPLVKGPLSFRPVSILFVVMAGAIGVFASKTRLVVERGPHKRMPWNVIAAIAALFALSFLVVGFAGIKLSPHTYWAWMSSFFAFCGLFMLWMAERVRDARSHPKAKGRRLAFNH